MRFAIIARLSALWHLLRGHNLKWRVNADDLCPGDIVCEGCPDALTILHDVLIWCRAHDPWRENAE